MIREVLRANLDQTLADLYEQTGLRPGAPTGQCHGVFVGALTGRRMDFSQAHQPDYLQEELEYRHGLVRAKVDSFYLPPHEVLAHLMTQHVVSFDAILVRGMVTVEGQTGSHGIAIVADQAGQPFGIVDSLARGAFVETDDPSAIVAYTTARFNAEGEPTFGLALDAAAQARRTMQYSFVELGERILAVIPPADQHFGKF